MLFRSDWFQPNWWGLYRPITWVDPLAQTFLCDTKGGAFLTSIDLYFAAKDPNLPVTLQIRTVVNGTPTQTILPYSEVTLPAEYINVYTGSGTDDASTKTTFVFESPVHVMEGVEYAFVVQSNSNLVQLWTSQLGEYDVASNNRITSQPYAGVFFSSANASTWTPDQSKDIKFNIRRAVFTQNTGTLYFNEAVIPSENLKADAVETESGSKIIRVYHKNHGHFAGSSKVTLAGVEATSGSAINGIPLTYVNTTHTVQDIEFDSYTIDTSLVGNTTNASADGRAGGSSITATNNRLFNVMHPIVSALTFSDCSLSWQAKTTSGASLAESDPQPDRKSTRLNSSHIPLSRMPSSA